MVHRLRIRILGARGTGTNWFACLPEHRAETRDGDLAHSSTVPAALRTHAVRRTVPGQAWRIGSQALLGVATMSRGAALRDRIVGAAGRLSPASARVS